MESLQVAVSSPITEKCGEERTINRDSCLCTRLEPGVSFKTVEKPVWCLIEDRATGRGAEELLPFY